MLAVRFKGSLNNNIDLIVIQETPSENGNNSEELSEFHAMNFLAL